MASAKTIPLRSEIGEQYKWNAEAVVDNHFRGGASAICGLRIGEGKRHGLRRSAGNRQSKRVLIDMDCVEDTVVGFEVQLTRAGK